ncbi:T6SS effector phospholipase Tle3 domain-containing protein [Serratia ficaria]|uniref:Alpha/beta hydrolase family n=1 Tax=Serratia ficaria TaxID=61651 RepID=A0A240BV21_SERFI|nr:DUF3274 domain-containing protein [Serratia ficaria]REF45389.1 uncharacterized protein DUF3274 [Serratia ficaria]CAI0889972.1 Uncharacterised protein [Serratia ficaria]CAI0891438.1 Uncharacterised protein [Serratia ficaria]CAI0941847.1 Uncharacterised protein [Serratia ficaria]CAI2016881.1 Uncharacterised protein [Serratia ficaria]
MTNRTEPVRELDCQFDDNGNPSWCSFPSHKNVQVRGACDLPPHLPGIVIFVHGVNSTGEWYQNAEVSLCSGLNKRLGLMGTSFELKENIYSNDGVVSVDKNGQLRIEQKNQLIRRVLPKPKKDQQSEKSPVIRFYWGYSSLKGEEDKYVIPLANQDGVDYHQLKRQGLSHEDIMKQGPFFWGGGPFQNGTNNLHALWSEKGFDENIMGISGVKTQWVNEDEDRLLTHAPPRKYYAHAAKRLADLLDLIREKYPRDTVSIISHSQGTMVAMAATALAKQAPDTLFILNSPFAMDNPQLHGVYLLPAEENISVAGRESTLSAIVNKVAQRATHLADLGYEGLCVGQSQDKKNWRPDIQHTAASEGQSTVIPERDNHGRTWIYFCPHDRVMGSLPLRSVGWQGLPNDKQGNPHKLLNQHQGHLFQRMLARSISCGDAPNPRTPFANLPDEKPFWDDKGDKYQSSSTTYPEPPAWQSVFINAEQVLEPIKATELIDFDKTRVGSEHDAEQKDGWGEFNVDGYKNDNTYDNYINLYPNQDVVIGFKQGPRGDYDRIPITRKETFEEKDLRLRSYVSQPTDHSTLPGNAAFMSRVVAYDLPVGYCDATWDKNFMDELRRLADWTQGLDPYLTTGTPNKVEEPALISRETMLGEMIRNKTKEYGY